MTASAIQPEDIHPLTDFLRHSKAHIKRLKKRGRPAVLTLNGKAEVVLIDATSYQTMVEAADTARGIREGIRSMEKGKGVLTETALRKLKDKHGLR